MPGAKNSSRRGRCSQKSLQTLWPVECFSTKTRRELLSTCRLITHNKHMTNAQKKLSGALIPAIGGATYEGISQRAPPQDHFFFQECTVSRCFNPKHQEIRNGHNFLCFPKHRSEKELQSALWPASLVKTRIPHLFGELVLSSEKEQLVSNEKKIFSFLGSVSLVFGWKRNAASSPSV